MRCLKIVIVLLSICGTLLNSRSMAQDAYASIKSIAAEDIQNGYVASDSPIVGEASRPDGYLYWNIGEAHGIPSIPAVHSQYKVAILRQHGTQLTNGAGDGAEQDGTFWEPYLVRVERIIADEVAYISTGGTNQNRIRDFGGRKYAVFEEAFGRIAAGLALRQKWDTQKQVARKLGVAAEPSSVQLVFRSTTGVGNIMWANYAQYRCLKVLNQPFQYEVIRQGEKKTIVDGARYAYYVDKGGPPPAVPFLKVVQFQGEDFIILPE